MKLIHAINNAIATIEFGLVLIIVSIMVCLAFVQIILRNFFATSIAWADILLRHLVLWIGFVGASLATKDQRHINIDVLSKVFPATVTKIANVVTSSFAAVICYFLMRASISFISMEREMGTTLFADIPMWLVQSIIAIGFGLMTLRFIIHMIEGIVQFRKPGRGTA
ncbi:TRAP transporter small permease [candidate division KSB1 bacterium]|nr:TRAP transporter small permease [candidate division KSB1 bacterium]